MMKCDTVSSVLFLGDSIAKGVMLDEDRNRYVFLQHPFAQRVAELFGIDLENRARFGSTIAKGREQWEKWMEKGKRAEVVLLEFGGNDCDFHWDEVGHDPVPEHHIPNTELASFILQYTDLVRDIQQHGLQPVMMTLPPIDAKRYFAWVTSPEKVDDQGVLAFLGDVEHIYRWHESYSLAVWQVAQQTHCPVIDMRSKFLKTWDYRRLLCKDGIHPNEQGHEVMADALQDFARTYGLPAGSGAVDVWA